jgi:glycosyltransferase involved in cell wall biosynthesis
LPPIEALPTGGGAHRIGVCLLVDDLTPDAGTERQVEATVAALHREFDIHVCCFFDSDRFRRLSAYCNTALFPVARVYSPNALWQMLRFRRYLRRHDIHIVHAWMVNTTIFGGMAAAKSGARLITSRLNTGYWHTPGLLRWYRFVNRFTDRVFANSEGAKQVAIATEGLPPDKIDVIYNGVDTLRYSPESGDPEAAARLGIPPAARVVGIVANLRPVKDIPLFLRAAAIIAARVPDAMFLIAGKGELRDELGRLAAELGIGRKVFFTDGRGAIEDYLPRMSVACLSSRSEGFSNAILEYMAAGLPIVATDVGGNAEAVSDGETGYIVRERTPEAFAAPVIHLLESENVRAAMARRALDRCRRLFSMDAYGERMREYYRSLARPAHPRSGER